MPNKIFAILFIIFLLIIMSSCSTGENKKNPDSNYTSEIITSAISTENTEDVEYEKKLSLLKECITLNYYIDNNIMTGIYYNQDSDKIFLATIAKKQILISNDELSATTELVPLNNSFALIDYGPQKKIQIFQTNLDLVNEFDLTNYYKNSRTKNYFPGEIILSKDGKTICFFVSTIEKDIIYSFDNNNSPRIIYEFNKSKAIDNEVSGISRLLCINNSKIYFEGSALKNGITSNIAVLGYINLDDLKIYEILKKSNASYYADGLFIYSQDYQISNQDVGSGQISIIDSRNGNISDVATTRKYESLNCLVSINGNYCCTFEENENSTLINIYNIKSKTLIKSVSTNLDVTKNTVFIDEKNKVLYISSSTAKLKCIEKFKF